MKVILRQDVDGLGRKGEVCEVAEGHFRNLLNPRGLAMKATKGAEAQGEAMRRAATMRNAESRAEAEEVATKLVPTVITISAKAGDGGRLFGSVTEVEIVAAVEAQTGVVIERRSLNLESHLKELGQTMVMCKLHPEVEFPITVEIVEE
ncbi:MAG: 50S ribosomal protein L9 [Acidimicrobiales bacterium]